MRDADVRAALRARLRAEYAEDSDTRIVEEMGVWSGSVRIDVAVINGELTGFELKSDRDTLERLPLQADLYGKVFDRLVLVCGTRHMARATKVVPDWWGIMQASDSPSGISLELVRLPAVNPSPDSYLLAQLLWKREALAILSARGGPKGLSTKRVKDLHLLLSGSLPYAELSEQVRLTLKSRTNWLGQVMPRLFDVAID